MLYYWAYKHTNGSIQVKRLFWPGGNIKNDLEYAKEEKAAGNSFIAVIIDKPIEANNMDEAREIAYKLLISDLDPIILLYLIDTDDGETITFIQLPQSQIESLKTLLVDKGITVHPADFMGQFKTADEAAEKLLGQ